MGTTSRHPERYRRTLWRAATSVARDLGTRDLLRHDRLPHDPVRVLATQAYTGRRGERFREEFILALKLIEEGRLRPARRRSSWAGAMGLVQFLPSDLYRYGVDADRDGDVDIWTSVADALASAANQLKEKGWRSGIRWGHEVRAPPGLDCTIAEPAFKLPVREWLARGFVPAKGSIGPSDLAEEASLILPAGNDGPAFLLTRNYFVLKDYNFSDLYALFVGNLSDRIAGGSAFAQLAASRAGIGSRDRGDAATPDGARVIPRQDRR